MLAAKKVFPQKVAGAEQAGKDGKGFLVAEKRKGLLLGLAFRVLHGEVEKLVEGFQRLGRVRRPGQGMGELFDEHRGQAQLLLIDGIGQLLAVAIADIEAVVQLAALDRELRFGNVDVAHRQGVGEGVEKRRGIIRLDIHHGIGRGLAVVESDLNGVKEPAERTAALSQIFDELPVHGLARFVELVASRSAIICGEFGDEPAAIV